jgi:proline dehydrogenase
VPFGQQWYPYFMRRLGERPANVWFVLKSLLRER